MVQERNGYPFFNWNNWNWNGYWFIIPLQGFVFLLFMGNQFCIFDS